MNQRFSGARPSESNRVQEIALGRETKILRRVVGCVGAVKRASRDFRGPFAVGPPRPSAVDGLSVYIQPQYCPEDGFRGPANAMQGKELDAILVFVDLKSKESKTALPG